MLSRSIAAAIASLLCASACTGNAPHVTPLDIAARTGNVARIRALVAAGADPNAPGRGGTRWTPLLHAIHKGQRASVTALIEAGADVNRASPSGLSPLEMAAGNGQADIVRRLLAAGADPREPGVFTAAVSGGAMSDIDRPLDGTCNPEIVRSLLERAPDLRLPRNARGHLSYLFARLNQCEDVLSIARFGS
jgi:ankyrin repeat protein